MNNQNRLNITNKKELRCLYIIVAYKTENLAINLASEIRKQKNSLSNEVIVIINSEKKVEEKIIRKDQETLLVYSGKNLGYF